MQDWIFSKVTGLQSVASPSWQAFSLEFCKTFRLIYANRCLWTGLTLKVGFSPSKNFFNIWFNDSPSKMIKNAFYFILKALSVLKIFKSLS